MSGEKQVCLLVGTHKGGFLFRSDLSRRNWEMSSPFFSGNDVNHLILDLRDKPTLICLREQSLVGIGCSVQQRSR